MTQSQATAKTSAGNFFEDFTVGQVITHATPRTITTGDGAIYNALYGSRFALQSSDEFARIMGHRAAPADDLLVFHMILGKTVPDISRNAVANLGYADCRFYEPVYPGDTLTAQSEIIGIKENSNGRAGVVYLRSTGRNQRGEITLKYIRWVMVNKRDQNAPKPTTLIPDLPAAVAPSQLGKALPPFDSPGYDTALAGSPHRWADYSVGERIDHVDGVTIEETEHQMATRLYQNTAKIHFDAIKAARSRYKRRLIYGGVVMSIARALSFNGLGNACYIAAINGGRHVSPCFAGDTIYAWSQILALADLPGRTDLGALRLRLIGVKNRSCETFPDKNADGTDDRDILLDLDLWVLMPR